MASRRRQTGLGPIRSLRSGGMHGDRVDHDALQSPRNDQKDTEQVGRRQIGHNDKAAPGSPQPADPLEVKQHARVAQCVGFHPVQVEKLGDAFVI